MAGQRRRIGVIGLVLVGLVVALALAAFASPFASSAPDGLNKVAADQGFDAHARNSATAHSPLAGYTVADVQHEQVSKGLSGVIGVGITVAVAAGVFGGLWFVVRRRATVRPVGAGPVT